MAITVRAHPLISIRSSATVQEAAHLMADCSIGAIGVLDQHHQFIGIVTERDLSCFVAQGKDSTETAIGAIVNDFPVVVEGPIDDSDALDRMCQARVRHLIVHEDYDFRIVSMRDYLAEVARRDPTAQEIMTAPVVAVREDAFFEEVADVLSQRDISGMPVLDRDSHVVGVVSERDLAYALGGPLVRLALRRHSDHRIDGVTELPRSARRVRAIMTTPAITVTSDAGLEGLAWLMRLHQINRLPVLDDSDRLVGIVTRGDLLGAIAHLPHQVTDRTSPPILVGSAGLHPANGMYE